MIQCCINLHVQYLMHLKNQRHFTAYTVFVQDRRVAGNKIFHLQYFCFVGENQFVHCPHRTDSHDHYPLM